MDVEKVLETRIAENLSAVEYDGPQRFIWGALIPVLVELVAQVLTNCLNPEPALGQRMNIFQKARLRRELIEEVYDGDRKEYRRMEGRKVLAALVKSAEEAKPEEVEAVMSQVAKAK